MTKRLVERQSGDDVLPREDDEEDREGRFQQLRALTASAAILWMFFTIRNLGLHRPRAALAQGIGSIVAAAIFVLVRKRSALSLRWLLHVTLTMAGSVMCAVGFLNGGFSSTTLFTLSLLPPIAAYILGIRAALFWAVVSFAAAVAVGSISQSSKPEFLQGPAEIVLGHLTMHVVLLLTALAARRAHDAQIARTKNSERLVRIQARELEGARDRALDGSRLKSEFLATMSHEIRTPLNGVLGMATVLLDTNLDAAQRDMVQTLKGSGQSLLSILNDILDFSKIEAGRVEIARQVFDIRQCVEDAVDLFGIAAAEKGIDLAGLVAPDVPARLVGDPARIRQILVNLVSNAVKFTAKGEVVVSCSIEQSKEDLGGAGERDRRLVLTVRDTGIGIERDRLTFVFDSFTQADASTTRRFGGTGLGLAIVKRLAGLMGGEVLAQSVVGKGSTFRLGLPFALPDQEIETLAEASHADVMPELSPTMVRNLDVVVCIQHAATRQHIQNILKMLAIQAEVADEDSLQSWVDRAGPEPRVRLMIVDDAQADLVNLVGSARLRIVRLVRSRALARVVHRDHSVVFQPVRRNQLMEVFAALEDQQPKRTRRKPFAAGLHALRVLVAEDNVANQKVARLMLERLGHEVDVVANGKEAVAATLRHVYDLLLTDIEMPEMDGMEATRTIRERVPRALQPRIVALTAGVLDEQRRACIAAGMDEFVAKPIVRRELSAVIDRLSSQSILVDQRTLRDLAGLLDDDPAALRGLIGDFLSSAEKLMKDLEESLATEDWVGIRQAAHTLKGSSGTVGAFGICRMAAKIESSIDLAQVRQFIGELTELYRKSVTALAVISRSELRN